MKKFRMGGTTVRIQALRGNSGRTAPATGADEITLIGNTNTVTALVQGQGEVAVTGHDIGNDL